jgi:hypothetical protein
MSDQSSAAAAAPTVDERLASLETRTTALEKAVAALKPPQPPPVWVPMTPSPDRTYARKAGEFIVTAKGNQLLLVDDGKGAGTFAVKFNTKLDPATHGITQLVTVGGVGWQQADGWWYNSTDVFGNWGGHTQTDPTVKQQPPPGPPPQGKGARLIAAYCWNYESATAGAATDARLAQLQTELGCTINGIGMFPLWGDQNGWAANLDMLLSNMRTFPIGGKCIPLIGMKFFWQNWAPQNYSLSDPQGFRDVIAGKYDAMYRGLVRACMARGFPTAILRLSYEHNFQFMSDSPGWSADTQQLWKQAFEHVYDITHDEAAKVGMTWYVMCNPTLGGGSQPVESFVPAANKMDIFGADSYNGYYGSGDINVVANRTAWWQSTYYGMDHHIALAQKLGKGIMFPEIGSGLKGGGANGLKNDVAFWDWTATQIKRIRALPLPFYGCMFWNVSPDDIDATFSGGAQPAVSAAIKKYIADGTFIGDPLP